LKLFATDGWKDKNRLTTTMSLLRYGGAAKPIGADCTRTRQQKQDSNAGAALALRSRLQHESEMQQSTPE